MFKFSPKRAALLALILCFAVCCAPLFAQGDRGVVTGKVTDKAGGVIPDAQVQLIDDASKVALRTKSDEGGAYSFPSVVPGKYTLIVVVSGFSAFKVEHFQVDLGIPTQIDAPMQVGKVDETVTVEGQAQQLNYDSADLGLVVEEKSMTDLPLVYGNAFSLENLAPGVTLSGVNPNIHVYDSGTSNVSINGSLYNSIDYKLDGAADNRIRSTAFTPNTESIAQYRLTTSSYDTSQGHASGGFTNVQTKSGTDNFHGSIFGYYQNPDINANSWTLAGTRNQIKPTFIREGFSFGGPLWRRKLFFFTGFEHSSQTNPTNGAVNIPTPAEISGDFSALLGLDTTAGHKTCGSSPSSLTGPVNAYQIFDPRTSDNSQYRLCIPGNNIANYPGGVDPVAKNILKYYPKVAPGASQAYSVYNYSIGNSDNYTGAIVRVDYAISPSQQLFVHALRSSRLSQPALVFAPVSTAYLSYDNWGLAVGHTIAVSPSLVITSTASYTRFRDNNQNPVEGQVTPATLGMPAYLVNGLPHSAAAFPRFDLTGYQSTNTASDYFGADDTWLGNVSISKQLRTHFLRTGFEYRRYITSGESGGTENGDYASNGNYATQNYNNTAATTAGGLGYSVAELEMGILSSGTQNQNSDYFTRSHYYAAYLQDDWRATNRLTVNLGLRWERETPMEELNGKDIVAFNFNATNAVSSTGAANYASSAGGVVVGAGTTEPITLPATINPVGGAVFANTNGFGLAPYTAQAYQWGPRAGISYSFYPTLVLHAGFGLFYDSLQTYYLSSVNSGSTTTVTLAQQGYSQTTSVVAPTDSGGPGITSTLDNPFPAGLTPVVGNRAGINTALGNDIQFLTPNPHTPYNERWNLGLQQQFGQFVISLSYVGNRGVHTPTAQSSMGTNYGGRDYNATPDKYLSTVQGGLDQIANKTTLGGTVSNPFYQIIPGSTTYLSSTTTSVAQLLRPRPEFGRINSYTFDGSAFYNSLQLQVQRRFTRGLSTTQALTWSKAVDSTTFLNPGDVKPWHGLSTTDRPLRYSGSVIYQLPWGRDRRWLSSSRGVLAQIVGGWQVQGVYQVQSGGPLNFGNIVYRYGDPTNSSWSRKQYKASQRLGSGIGGYWFNPKDYLVTSTIEATLPLQYQSVANTAATCLATLAFCPTGEPSGNQLRTFPIRFSGLRSDNLNQADVGIQRQFQVGRIGSLQFRAEAVNVFNHPVYAAPSVDPTNALFDQITAQGNAARVFQFAAFFRF